MSSQEASFKGIRDPVKLVVAVTTLVLGLLTYCEASDGNRAAKEAAEAAQKNAEIYEDFLELEQQRMTADVSFDGEVERVEDPYKEGVDVRIRNAGGAPAKIDSVNVRRFDHDLQSWVSSSVLFAGPDQVGSEDTVTVEVRKVILCQVLGGSDLFQIRVIFKGTVGELVSSTVAYKDMFAVACDELDLNPFDAYYDETFQIVDNAGNEIPETWITFPLRNDSLVDAQLKRLVVFEEVVNEPLDEQRNAIDYLPSEVPYTIKSGRIRNVDILVSEAMCPATETNYRIAAFFVDKEETQEFIAISPVVDWVDFSATRRRCSEYRNTG